VFQPDDPALLESRPTIYFSIEASLQPLSSSPEEKKSNVWSGISLFEVWTGSTKANGREPKTGLG
jgi:hypothetical protein